VLKFFANYSISKKLMLLVSATAGIVLLVAFVISTINDAKSAGESAEESLVTLADVIARNIASAIIFDDIEAAKETLASLQADSSVLKADVLDVNEKSFVYFDNSSHEMKYWLHALKPFKEVMIERPITHNAQRVGTIRVTADYDQVLEGVFLRVITNLLGVIIAFLLGYMFLRRMVGHIFAPIDLLTRAMSEIIDHEHYSLRVKKISTDELGNLTDGFNLMLSQIEYRDAKLRQSDQALAQTQEAITLHDENLCYQYVNPAFIVLFGYHLEELVGKSFSLAPETSSENAEPTQDEIFSIAREKGSYRGEVTLQTKSGKLLPISLHVSPIKDASDKITGYVSVSSDISDKKQAQEWIWRQANFDSVTGLPNRHMFHNRLEQEVELSQRTGTSFALMFLDLDDFKEVNDSIGHDMGDLLLKEVGERLIDCLRTTDTVGREGTVARLGGDEFTIILNNFSDIKNVDIVAQRILVKLTEPFQLGQNIVNISVSIGITLCPEDAVDAESLIRNADQTMYNAKNKGRNTYSYFTRSMQLAASKRREMTSDLRIAIEQEQFRLIYQPIVDLATNKIYKAEALLRWDHPEYGVINPGDFIPVAEETGLIVEIGNWVFFNVAEKLAEWRTSIDDKFQVSINKSPVQFYNKGDKHLAWFKYLNQLGISGSSLVIEITEGLMLDRNPEVSEKLLAFRDEGIQVAVDDFGTGYSSLSYLKKFDVDYIKIDQSFVQNLSIHSEDMVLCEAIIVMAHKLGLKVIAEGVETIEQRDLLFAVGCDYGQGYLFSRPVSDEALETLCIEQNKLERSAKPIYEALLEG
jgi:diguanylate cyclase (GGDEF)-like protein/PAS domain S-box-containing protein